MITVIGMDGTALGSAAARALAGAGLVVGARRHLDAVAVPGNARTVALGDLSSGLGALAGHDGDAVVLASGDPGFFGIARVLRGRGWDVTVLPAVSSVAQAFARIGVPWDDALVVSAHGRDPRTAVNVCRAHRKVAVLTAPGSGPAELAAALVDVPCNLLVAECLGTAEERVTSCTPADAVKRDWVDPNVVLVLHDDRVASPRTIWPAPSTPPGWALPEQAFEHRDSMVTKAEVRAQALPWLCPTPGALVWDVGTGSGSVAVECARFGAAVVAVDRDTEQCARVRRNSRSHGVRVDVVHGEAPEVLTGLPDPDAVFVGGGGPAVVAQVAARRPTRMVVALAALERVEGTTTALTRAGYAVDGVQLQASRLSRLPDGTHRLAATNPVLLVRGRWQG